MGSAHKDMINPKADGLDSHHMPDRNANPNVHPYNRPSIQMDKHDHSKTSSYGYRRSAINYRNETSKLNQGGRYRDAMAREIRDVR